MADANIQKALDAYYSGDRDTAGKLLKQLAASTDGSKPPAGLSALDESSFHELAGSLAMDRGDLENAVKSFKLMVEREESAGGDKNNLATSYGKLGEALASFGKTDDAVAAFEKGCVLKEEANAPAPSRVNLYLQYGQVLLHASRNQKAAEWLRKALKAGNESKQDDGTLAHLNFFLGEALKPTLAQLHATRKFQEVVRQVQQEQTGKSGNEDAQQKKILDGWQAEAENCYNTAIKLAEKVKLPAPTILQMQRGLAEVYHDGGKPVPAVMARRKAVKLSDEAKVDPLARGFIWHGLAESLKELGQNAEAVKTYEGAIKHKQAGKADGVSLAKSYFGLGEALIGEQKLDPAVEAIRAAIKHEDGAAKPDKQQRLSKYYNTLGMVLQAAGKEKEAEEALKMAKG
ncbi:MAG: tetratricopeptide repeat protein [Planctomycetes bacterium]|nr:tetratricopeptide repeat protein [Planctomycetota bacterium]